MSEVQARVSPEGFVAQRLTDDQGQPRWILTSMVPGAGLTVSLLDDDEVAGWPHLLPEVAR